MSLSRFTLPVLLAAASAHAASRQVSFQHEILPVLTRQGCNAGTCHGSPSGKGGFALSLFAFDAAADYAVLTRDLLGRRVDVFTPSLSLILRKPSTALAHRGGLTLPQDRREYRILRDWIDQGARTDPPGTARCEGIEVTPGTAVVLRWPEPVQHLRVTARFEDGSQRDVTHLAKFTSSAEAILKVDSGGRVAGRTRGQAAVMVRYLEHVAALPFTLVKPAPASTGSFHPQPTTSTPMSMPSSVSCSSRLLGCAATANFSGACIWTSPGCCPPLPRRGCFWMT